MIRWLIRGIYRQWRPIFSVLSPEACRDESKPQPFNNQKPLAHWKADLFVLINLRNEFSSSLSTSSVNALIVCEQWSEEKNAKRWKVRRVIFLQMLRVSGSISIRREDDEPQLHLKTLTPKWDWGQKHDWQHKSKSLLNRADLKKIPGPSSSRKR